MRARVLGILVLATLIGVAGGIGVGYLHQPQPASGGPATPLPASSPSVPVDPPKTEAPYAPDIRYAALEPGVPLGVQRMGNQIADWKVPVPKGWQASTVPGDEPVPKKQRSSYDELRWRPADEPEVGGYSLRVKTVNAHFSPSVMMSQRLDAVRELYGRDNVHVIDSYTDAVTFTFRDGNQRLRYNYFKWFVGQDSSEASLEMSVAGRESDVAGLDDLFTRFADGLEQVG